LNQEKE